MARLNYLRMAMLLVMLLPTTLLSAGNTVTVSVSELEQVKVATSVFNLKGIADIVEALNANSRYRVGIFYGNDNMRAWADKMEQWLVALGIETKTITKQVGVVAEGLLVLELNE